ncbi:hypothetical protein FIBSPDRAFT_574169 [Athelia psychrophila]|uniref:Uncharacterized protein n=1 Tax=Athelia psychrophila TaxID=1759441 RepID=A0A166HIW3_9AGAM|nr:hypothetical protein FIBSPDRAFT_574169 [Fibularhizoctonia sp. CBS 109695]
MSTGEKRPRTMSSDEAMLPSQSKMVRLESGDGRQNRNRAEVRDQQIYVSHFVLGGPESYHLARVAHREMQLCRTPAVTSSMAIIQCTKRR